MTIARRMKAIGVIILVGTVAVIAGALWVMSQPQPRLTQVKSLQTVSILHVTYGHSTLYLTNGSHLFVYDHHADSVTDCIRVPGEALGSVDDMAAFDYDSLYIANDNGTVQCYSDGVIVNIHLPQIATDLLFHTVAADNVHHTLYLGGTTTGVYILDITTYEASNITTSDGLLSNQVDKLSARGNLLLVRVAGGIHVYDTSSGQLYNVTGLPDPIESATCMEYYSGTTDLYVGTQSGLHICRLSDRGWSYILTRGPSDGLPSSSIEDLDLDYSGHKMVVSTALGVCLVDLFDYSVTVLEETTQIGFHPTELYHEYRGAKCYVYFGASGGGLWQFVIDYTAKPTFDWSQTLRDAGMVTLGAALAAVVSIVDSMVTRYWDRQDRRRQDATKTTEETESDMSAVTK